jgi:glycosyltransferase involved in cell wall biosynthesis
VISVVLPTYNRMEALRANFDAITSLDGVEEIVVVDDASTDGTSQLLRARADERVRLVRQPRHAGSPAARNLGARLARGDWVLFAEDDCRFPPDYTVTLQRDALDHGADVAGAPMVHLLGRPLETALAAARAAARDRAGLDEVAGFSPQPLITPFLPAPALVSRAVLDRLRFDERYDGNAYREETDFFLRATRLGFVCLLTPRTYFWEAARWPGGQARSRAATEYWTIRNNWRFLRRHGSWLARNGYLSSPLREQLSFIARRLTAG